MPSARPMPELPEVETIRRHLAPHVEGRTLERLEVLDPRWSRPLAPRELVRRGRRAARSSGSSRRGKYLVWELSGDVYLLVHLRMTGTLLLDPRRHAAAHPRRGSSSATTGSPTPTRGASAPASWRSARTRCDAFFAARLGVEPLGPDFTGDAPARARAHARARRSRRSCSTSGASPASGTSTPTRRCSAPGSTRCGRPTGSRARRRDALRDAVVASLEAGLAAKGATIDDFRHPDGVAGTFQDRVPDPPARGRAVPATAAARCASCAPPGAGPTCASAASRGRARRRRSERLSAGPTGTPSGYRRRVGRCCASPATTPTMLIAMFVGDVRPRRQPPACSLLAGVDDRRTGARTRPPCSCCGIGVHDDRADGRRGCATGGHGSGAGAATWRWPCSCRASSRSRSAGRWTRRASSRSSTSLMFAAMLAAMLLRRRSSTPRRRARPARGDVHSGSWHT